MNYLPRFCIIVLVLGLMVGCNRFDPDPISGGELFDDSPPMLTGTWRVQAINSVPLHTYFNIGTGDNVKNAPETLWTFGADGSWTYDLDIHTTYTDAPSLKMKLAISYTGTWIRDTLNLTLDMTDVNVDAVITPPENADILLGKEETVFEEEYVKQQREHDTLSGVYQIEYDGDTLTLTRMDPNLAGQFVITLERK